MVKGTSLKCSILVMLVWLCVGCSSVQAQDTPDITPTTPSLDLQPPTETAEVLILIARGLDVLPAELFDLDWFTALSIGNHSVWIRLNDYDKGADNTFVALPPEIGQLQQLEILEITDSRVSELPSELGQLHNLTSLILVDANLDELPPAIGELENLQSLNVRGNQLSDLPEAITQLVHLRHIDLSRNNFTTVPPELYDLPALETVYLQNNSIPMQEIERLTNHLHGRGNITVWLLMGGLLVVVAIGIGVVVKQRQ